MKTLMTLERMAREMSEAQEDQFTRGQYVNHDRRGWDQKNDWQKKIWIELAMEFRRRLNEAGFELVEITKEA